MPTPRTERAILAASESICWFLVERRGRGGTVAEMAAAAGLNERTFYRYFATRHDAVRPVLDWGAALMSDAISSGAHATVRDAVESSFAEIVGGEHAERTRRLFPLIFADRQLKAVLLSVYHDAEDELCHALAALTGQAAGALRVRVASAKIVGLTRLALEVMVATGSDPLDTLSAALELEPGGWAALGQGK